MGKQTLPSNKKVKSAAVQDRTEAEVLRLLEKLSELLRDHREREGLDQKTMAESLDIGQSRYNEIEKLRNLNPAFGVSLAFLLRFAILERTTLSRLVQSLEGKQPVATGRDEIDEKLVTTFSEIGHSDRERFLDEVTKQGSTKAVPNRLRWWLHMGLDLLAMSEKEQLEFEMSVHQQRLKAGANTLPDGQERRSRIYSIMKEILDNGA